MSAESFSCAARISSAVGGMPAFKSSLSATQIKDVAAYVTKSITKTGK